MNTVKKKAQAVVENRTVTVTPERTVKRTDEELQTVLTQCQGMIGRKCQAVLYGTLEWQPGYIKGAYIEPRARQVFYNIKLEGDKVTKKVYNSNLLKISEEMAEVTIRTRSAEPKGLWEDEDEIKAELEKWAPTVGKMITLETGETGRIIGLVVEKRAHAIQLKTLIKTETEERLAHKTAKEGLAIAEEYDEEGRALQERYQERRAKRPRKVLTREEKLAKLEAECADLMARLAAKQAQIKVLQEETEETETTIEDLA